MTARGTSADDVPTDLPQITGVAGRILLGVLVAILAIMASISGSLIAIMLSGADASSSLDDGGARLVGFLIGLPVGAGIGAWSAQTMRRAPRVWRTTLGAFALGGLVPLPLLFIGAPAVAVFVAVAVLVVLADYLFENRLARRSSL